ncbi:MAG: hypothetical protein RLZZ297_1639, partial [Chloroflexota bacterium]
MTAYGILLILHSWTRWAVLVTAVMAIVPAILGWLNGAHWDDKKSMWSSWFVNTTSIQLVLGLILYGGGISAVMSKAFSNFGGAMKDGVLRFWAVEHIMMMVIAVALTHIGAARIKKAASDIGKHRVAVIFFGIALLIIISSIPWPSTGADPRPLFRFA